MDLLESMLAAFTALTTIIALLVAVRDRKRSRRLVS